MKLTATLASIEGCDNEIVFRVQASRRNKAGRFEEYDFELVACRYGVRQILEGLRDMHMRDRARIQLHQRRIADEQVILSTEPK